jgi:hypothetical protein
VNLGEVLAQNVDPARWNADVSPYLLGLRMLSGVAENEAAMFEKVSGSGVDGVAGFHTWMQDVRPGDQVKLFLRLPLSEPPQNMAPSKEKR